MVQTLIGEVRDPQEPTRMLAPIPEDEPQEPEPKISLKSCSVMYSNRDDLQMRQAVRFTGAGRVKAVNVREHQGKPIREFCIEVLDLEVL